MAALVAIDPIVGTEIGDAASSSRLPDFSPAGLAAREALVSGTLLQLGSATVDGDAERSARTVLAEALEAQRDRQRIGEPFRRLRNYDAPLDEIRVGFDLMPTGAADDWDAVVARMRAVPEAVAGVEATLREGLARGLPAARRQAAVVGAQALAWGGLSGDGYFTRLLAGAPQLPGGLHADTPPPPPGGGCLRRWGPAHPRPGQGGGGRPPHRPPPPPPPAGGHDPPAGGP